METVGDRLAQAQASGDLSEVRSALEDAKKAGADPAQIEAALAEVERMQKAAEGGGAAATAAPAPDPEAEARARADAHKKRGNDALKAGTKTAAREALESFTEGIAVHCSDAVLNAQLHSNRAHVRMLLRQFVEAVDDCRKAIEFDAKNLKAYWRAAKASLHLDLHQNGIEFCEAGLQQEPNDGDLVRLRDTCAEKLQAQQLRRSVAGSGGAAGDFNADEAMAVQDKVTALGEQVDMLKGEIAGRERQKMKSTLTRNQLIDVPAETRLFRAVGRCFMAEERSKVDESLNSTIASVEEEVPKLRKALSELEKRKDGAEKEFQEIVRAFKQQKQ